MPIWNVWAMCDAPCAMLEKGHIKRFECQPPRANDALDERVCLVDHVLDTYACSAVVTIASNMISTA